jgi:hypothetical protein
MNAKPIGEVQRFVAAKLGAGAVVLAPEEAQRVLDALDYGSGHIDEHAGEEESDRLGDPDAIAQWREEADALAAAATLVRERRGQR